MKLPMALVLIELMVGACAARVVSTDGCAWTKPITLDDDAFIVFAARMHELRMVTDQINDHNDARKKVCQ
jgi:hypothetical protein